MTLFLKKMFSLPAELWQNRQLIWKLSKNDFKTRYAGSYLGIIWAFVQPVITILVYWLVFEKGFSAKGEIFKSGVEVPFVVYLTSGLVPWFFFSEAINNATNALLEYNYLVKKVVFKISILPLIKIIAASFIHVFFIGVLLIIYFLYGYRFSPYTLQLLYYSFCLFILVLALSYTFCSVVIFFRDLTQIVNIALQIGMWATPIMWSFTRAEGTGFEWIFRLNPVFYIVTGYRQALFDETWFWQQPGQMAYFWILTIALFALGTFVFKRLKPHFADVL
ncbi:MAG: ABC transporter permease [Roseburia sp.]|nr:ABC transporter permease [Roseburia sp.]MCM1278772.1 ABC transporter permease [Robinsoniella sp.]